MHVDHHGLWIDPDNTDYLVNVNDGGVAISYDGGKNWRTFSDNLPLAQFFNVMYDMDTPFHVYGSIQDHGSFKGIVDLSQRRDHIPAAKWEGAPGGEGSSHAIDPTDPNIVYSAGFYGSISRTDISKDERTSIVPKAGEGEPKLRGQWLAPFVISQHNHQIIYHGMNFLFRSLDRGDHWQKISPDLTYNDPNKSGDISYQTIFTISESPLKFGLIYVGTDDGRAHVTKDYGLNWQELSTDLPKRWISRIVASAFDEGTVYMSQNGKRDDDFAAYLWKSTDYGKTWEDIAGNIPCGPINVIREDPENKNVLYVGTDIGAYISIDGGKSWDVLAKNFPATFVHDMAIHSREDILVAGTHGRGAWAMDVRYVQQLTGETLAKGVYIYDIASVTLPRRMRDRFGEEAPAAKIAYFLKTSQEVKLVVLDESDQVVKELEAPSDAGLQFVQWDLKKAVEQKEKPEEESQPVFVEPGKYRIRLSTSAGDFEKEFEVLKSGD